MPQFIRNGPDIPERLLQDHEEGRVVFFCGAGISFPARLPGFGGLVRSLYSTLAPTGPNAVQLSAIKSKQFDTAIGLLEADHLAGRARVRRELAAILKPDLSAPAAMATHEALLTLSRNRHGSTRIITTNFDRLFEEVIAAKGLSIDCYHAPLLPVPKNRWDGLVYLHGLITKTPTESELNRLVASSGDFGLAYLTERWAARFVSELFRNYTVCFIGYSLNDPVMRYMMDALSADKQLGEATRDVFAFGSHSKGKEEEVANEWRAKNVTAILYREHNRHEYLHKTLRAWAETYRDGVLGKERIVMVSARAKPLASTQQDNFVDRLLWALSDPGGLPARRFAELDPVPSLDWLEPLSDPRYAYADLARFGVSPMPPVDRELGFSFMRRPAPYRLSPVMAIADVGRHASGWDQVMFHLAHWLLRHLDDPQLLLWIVKRGGQLHWQMANLIERRLDEVGNAEHTGDFAKLHAIRSSAPNGIPSQMMRKLWALSLSGRVRSPLPTHDLYTCVARFKRDGLTGTLRMKFREALTPLVLLREPFNWPSDDGEVRKPERIADLVGWDIVLAAQHAHSILDDLEGDQQWLAVLPEMLSDFTSLLRDALDLKRELGGADDRSDGTYVAQPSISEHPQNRKFDDWTVLIDLTRDAWIATAAQSPERAAAAAQFWWDLNYPLFRRLAFFAAAQGTAITTRRALDWLLADNQWWLWSSETQREAMRLLVAVAPRLDAEMRDELEQAILVGPPREMFRKDIEADRWEQISGQAIWRRLAKVAATGTILGPKSQEKLAAHSEQNPDLVLEADERDEFPYWMGSGDEFRTFVATPRLRRELIDYIEKHPGGNVWQGDDWRRRCSDEFVTTAYTLYSLTKKGIWPVDRWRDALQAWSEEKLLARSWRYMASLVAEAPDPILKSLAHGVTWWLRTIAKTFEGQEKTFFLLTDRIYEIDFEDNEDAGEPVSRAINHPVGHATEALLNFWYRGSLKDDQGLTGHFRTAFTRLCDAQVHKFQHARVLLASHVIALFRVDRQWATQNLLPHFDWERSPSEASAAWQSFLWSPRLYPALLAALKPAFLKTAHHYGQLGDHRNQYAALLTFVALDRGDTFTLAEMASATRALPPDGMQEAARTLGNALEGAGAQRADYWSNRIVPYLRSIWPHTRDNISPGIAESLGRLCIAAQDKFPDALSLLRPWLRSVSQHDYLVTLLHRAGLCTKFPEQALEFLSLVISEHVEWTPSSLRPCLNDIGKEAPSLLNDIRFQRLDAIARGG